MTGVGLFTSVNPVVLSEVDTLIVAFPTFLTPKRFLPSMDAAVLNKVCTLNEAFPTLVTLMWPLSWGRLFVDGAELTAIRPL